MDSKLTDSVVKPVGTGILSVGQRTIISAIMIPQYFSCTTSRLFHALKRKDSAPVQTGAQLHGRPIE